MKDVSIVSLTWNSEKDVKDFLELSISSLTNSGLNYEIIIVDNGSSDETLSIVETFTKRNSNILLIPLWRNFGTTKTRNLGLKISQGRYIFVMDSDTKPNNDFYEVMVKTFQFFEKNFGNLGILHPKLVYPDGSFQESARKFPTFKSKFYRLFDMEKLRTRTESIKEVLEERITPVHYAISACWLFKREIINKVGLLDEKIFFAPEDAEFCARLWKNGYMVMYYPRINLIHDAKRVTKNKPFTKLSFFHVRDLLRFWTRYDIDKLSKRVDDFIKEFTFLEDIMEDSTI